MIARSVGRTWDQLPVTAIQSLLRWATIEHGWLGLTSISLLPVLSLWHARKVFGGWGAVGSGFRWRKCFSASRAGRTLRSGNKLFALVQ